MKKLYRHYISRWAGIRAGAAVCTVYVLFLSVAGAGCGNHREEESAVREAPGEMPSAAETLAHWSLDILHDVRQGASPEAVRALTGGRRVAGPEGGSHVLAGEGLTEAVVDTVVAGYDLRIEANFRDDALYSLYMRTESADSGAAVALYTDLRGIFRRLLGEGDEETALDPATTSRTAFWSSGGREIVMTVTTGGGNSYVSWGVQFTQ